MAVNKDRVQLLVDALRSDNFHQGRDALEYVDDSGITRNCCLGVACRVAMANGVELTAVPSKIDFTTLDNGANAPKVIFASTRTYGSSVNFASQDTYGSSVNFITPEAIKWFGFDSGDPVIEVKIGGKLISKTATEANDTHSLSFAEIADGFERTYLTESE